ncbi:hypothetical protein TNCV_192391 [Trichonephila clavipes]|nr:hypothetical protein TNCV_192391 [Trichonephila clavipes]
MHVTSVQAVRGDVLPQSFEGKGELLRRTTWGRGSRGVKVERKRLTSPNTGGGGGCLQVVSASTRRRRPTGQTFFVRSRLRFPWRGRRESYTRAFGDGPRHFDPLSSTRETPELAPPYLPQQRKDV